jgi:hypothetical protein
MTPAVSTDQRGSSLAATFSHTTGHTDRVSGGSVFALYYAFQYAGIRRLALMRPAVSYPTDFIGFSESERYVNFGSYRIIHVLAKRNSNASGIRDKLWKPYQKNL